MVINLKDGTDYWAGGVTKPHGLHWISGAPMIFTDFYKEANKFHKFIHMNFYQGLYLGHKEPRERSRQSIHQ